jgi:peptide/nickel transport system permease protein
VGRWSQTGARRMAGTLLSILLLLAALAVCRPGASWSAQDRTAIAAPGSAAHWAGTDALGRDRLTRVALGTLLGFAGAVAAAGLSTTLAAALGLISASLSGLPAAMVLLLTDAFLALPWLFLLMMARAGLPLSTPPLAVATLTFLLLGLLGWPAAAHAVREGARQRKGSAWRLQTRAAGLGPREVLWHMLPQLRPLLLPQFLLSVPTFLIAEANLGTLGLGVGEPLPSWGSMLAELASSPVLLGSSSHWAFLPLAVLVCALGSLQLLLPQEAS